MAGGETADHAADHEVVQKSPEGREFIRRSAGQLGTRSRVVMQSGQRTMELTETITRREPADLHGIPKANPGTTLWQCESEYRFSGLLMWLVALLMPSAFHKQSQQHMQDFKEFAEQGKDVREGRN